MLSLKSILCVVLLTASIGSLCAEASDWRTAYNGMLYGYASSMNLRPDSVLNPANRIAKLARRSDHIEARFNLKAQNETLRLTARPIVTLRNERNIYGAKQLHEAYLSQWQFSVAANDQLNLAAGRELLNWGPAQFRSPSSPFYFNNGRSNPMRELSGMDVLQASWVKDSLSSVYFVRVLGSAYAKSKPDPWRNSWLIKYNQRGDDWSAGVVALKARHSGAFIGAHGQRTVSDALLVYAEFSSSTQTNVLNSPADSARPFSVSAQSIRKRTELLGASYTFEGGSRWSLSFYTTAVAIRRQNNARIFCAAHLSLVGRWVLLLGYLDAITCIWYGKAI